MRLAIISLSILSVGVLGLYITAVIYSFYLDGYFDKKNKSKSKNKCVNISVELASTDTEAQGDISSDELDEKLDDYLYDVHDSISRIEYNLGILRRGNGCIYEHLETLNNEINRVKNYVKKINPEIVSELLGDVNLAETDLKMIVQYVEKLSGTLSNLDTKIQKYRENQKLLLKVTNIKSDPIETDPIETIEEFMDEDFDNKNTSVESMDVVVTTNPDLEGTKWII